MSGVRVLLVEDDPSQAAIQTVALTRSGFAVDHAASWPEITRKIGSGPQVVLLDCNLPGLSGEQLAPILLRHLPQETLLILYSAESTEVLQTLAERLGIEHTLSKAEVSSLELPAKLRSLCEAAGIR